MKNTTTSPTNLIGTSYTIPAGTRVTCNGKTATRKAASTVTIRATETARNGKTRIVWKSMGVRATALLG